MKFGKLGLSQNESLWSLNQTVSKREESNSLFKNVLGWNMKRSIFNSDGVSKNFMVHSPHPEKKPVNTLQKFLITKTTLFILIFRFKRQFCHTASFNNNHTYSFRFNYWTTTFKYKKELKIKVTCVTAIIFSLMASGKTAFLYTIVSTECREHSYIYKSALI